MKAAWSNTHIMFSVVTVCYLRGIYIPSRSGGHVLGAILYWRKKVSNEVCNRSASEIQVTMTLSKLS